MHIVMELLAELLAVHGYSCSWWLQLNGANRETGRETGEGERGGGRGEGDRGRRREEGGDGEGGRRREGGREEGGGRRREERGETGAEFQLNKKSAQALSHETHRPAQR